MNDQEKEKALLLLEYVKIRLSRNETTEQFDEEAKARLQEIEETLGMEPIEILNASVKYLI